MTRQQHARSNKMRVQRISKEEDKHTQRKRERGAQDHHSSQLTRCQYVQYTSHCKTGVDAPCVDLAILVHAKAFRDGIFHGQHEFIHRRSEQQT